MKKVALGTGWLLSLVAVSFLTATSLYRNQFVAFGVKLDEVQAEFALNHMERYKELESDLSKGCYKEAQEKAKISKYQELALVAGFLQNHPNSPVSALVSKRDPALMGQLKSFKNPYGNTWTEPKCKK